MSSRKVRILHYNNCQYTEVFEWVTNKSGNIHHVLAYLVDKFRTDVPKGYTSRPLRAKDRIEITNTESGTVHLYEMISIYDVKEL